MKGNRVAPSRQTRAALLLALCVGLVVGFPPRARQAAALGNPSSDPPAPPALAWPADDPIVKSDSAGYLNGGGGITSAGDYRYSLPVWTPDGRAGMQPRLSLNYSSRNGNGSLGQGWSVDYGGSSIARCPKTFNLDNRTDSVNYLSGDSLCLDGQRLVEVSGSGFMAEGTEYRTVPDSFSRIVAHGDQGNGPETFEVFAKDGSIRVYKALTAKRVSSDAPGALAGTALVEDGFVKPVWVLTETRDRSGNGILYHYDVESEAQAPYNFEYRIHSIEYTARRNSNGTLDEPARREVVFEYSTVAERPDQLFTYESGVRRRVSRRLAWIKLYAPNPVAKEFIGGYGIAYESGPTQQKSFVESVTRYDRDHARLWSRRFEWQHAPPLEFDVHDVLTGSYGFQGMGGPLLFDVDNDGKEELEWLGSLYRTTAGSLVPFNSSIPVPGFHGRPCDVDGDGKMEILRIAGDQRVFMKYNAATGAFDATPFTLANTDTEFGDGDGDGRVDAFEAGPSVHLGNDAIDQEWFFRRNTGNGFAAPVAPFLAVPHMLGRPASVHDLSGDGRAELHAGWSPLDDPPGEGSPYAGGDWHYYALGTSDGGTLVHHAAMPEGPQSTKVLADINGDGLKDRLIAAGNLSTVRYNTGSGFLPAEEITTSIYPRLGKHQFIVSDLNNDGRDDLVSTNEGLSIEGDEHAPSTYLHLRTGWGFQRVDLGAAPYDIPSYDPYEPGNTPPPDQQSHSPIVTTADVNGDGLTDLVVFLRDIQANTSMIRVLVQKWHPRDVVHRVWDENAPEPRETVFYKAFSTDHPSLSSCAYPQRCLRGGMVTAREHWTHRQDEPGAMRRTAYEFDDARADARGHGFLGFGKVRTIDLDSFAETITTYDHATVDDGRYPFANLPAEQWTITPILKISPEPSGGVMLPPANLPITARVSHVHHDYQRRFTNGGASYAVFTTGARTDDWEQHVELDPDGILLKNDGSATAPRVRQSSRQIDDFGNETFAADWTIGGQRCETTTAYDNLTADWLLGLAVSSQVTCNKNGLPLPEPRLTTTEHDGRGLVKKVTVEPNHPELTAVTQLTRDKFGLVTKVVVSAQGEASRKTFLAYDDEHVYPAATWDSLAHYRRQLIHPAYGVPILGEDPNGVRIAYRYDGFGRACEIDPDDGPSTMISYQADPAEPWGLIVVRTGEDGSQSKARSDDRGRTLWTGHAGFDGSWVYDRVGYNVFGQASEIYRPAIGQAPSIKTMTTFDTLGRVVRVALPNGAETKVVHSMFESTTTDPEGRKSRVTRDADDRAVQTANLYNGQWIATSYFYGAFGQIEDIVDPANNAVHAMYDKLGRRILLDDPDRGTAIWSYSALGEVTSETDSLGDTTLYARDVLGRVTSSEHDVNGVTTFVYDGAGNPGEIGRLTSTASPDGVVTAYQYDAMGRNVQTTWQVGQEVYDVHRSYDPLGRLATIEYPQVPGRVPFVVRQQYNPRGYAISILDWSNPNFPKPLWQVTGRNEDGFLEGSLSANGFAETRDYDPVTGRLSNIEAVKDGSALFAVHYGRDLTGNILSRDDHAKGAPRTETFGYDELDRLKRWTVIHDQQTRTTTYGYDALGNIETISSPDGIEVHTHDGVMQGGVERLPHAITSRALGGKATSYTYDVRGRQIAGGGREIDWKPFDLPGILYQDGKATTFSYDAFGTRVRKVRRATGGVLVDGVDTIGGLYERRWKPGSPVEHVFYVHGSDGPVAQIVYTEGQKPTEQVLYLHQEALGSVGLVTDSKGEEIERTYFDPFGGKVDASGQGLAPALGDVKLGFTGHRHDDELGLIDMKGRIYDPAQKRFLTPDPHVTSPLFGQSYNRFAYVMNNPLRYTDPTGFDPEAGNPQGTNGAEPPDGAPLWPVELRSPEIVVTPEKSDAAGHAARQGDGPDSIITITVEEGTDESRAKQHVFDFLGHIAWGAAKHVLKSAPPVQMVRQLSHNLDLASVAASQVWAGDYGLALNTMLQLPYEGALGAASIVTGPIEAAIEVPDMVRTAIDAADPEVKGAAAVQALQDIATVGLTVVAVGQAVNGAGAAKGQSPRGAAHANHLDSPKPAEGYSLRDQSTGEVLKYGETTRGDARYTRSYLDENNAQMKFEANGTKREMHQWQHERIVDYKAQNGGKRPPLNKSDY